MVDTTWLETFLAEEEKETGILSANGADCQVEARARILTKLRAAAEAALAETVSVEEAAMLTGVNPETVRRAVRNGTVTDLRSSPRQTIRVLQRDLPVIAARRRKRA